MWLAVSSFLPFTPPFQTWDPSRATVDFDITSVSNPHEGNVKLTTPILPDGRVISDEPIFGQPLLYLPERMSRHSVPPIVLRL